jgi:DNA helicase IV
MPEPAAPADVELAAEQAHLAESRAQLARMRDRTAAMDASAGADWVSREYLESTFALRMKQLADDPTIALFFGRVDYEFGEAFHIGRRYVSDPSGEPMVIDWRAPMSRPFYRATRIEPMGVTLRRRYGFAQGRLTAYEDEHLTAGEAEEHSEILEAEIERPRVGPMRDIVATIQPEQDVIVRSELSRTICVQGAPGTGKTAVGLHRAAYLLYAYRQQLSRQGVLVVGPNASFLRYIRDVLPALGEIDARQTTIVDLVADTLARLQPRGGIRGDDSAAVATLKGDARMAAVLERALWSHLRTASEGLVVPRGARRFRVATYEIDEAVEALRRRGVRYGAGRTMLPQALAHRVLVKMELAGESPDDRVQDAVARSKPVKDCVAAIWPAVDPRRLVWRLLSEPDFLAEAADGVLDADEQAALIWPKPPRSAGAARWSLADAVLLDEAVDLVERTPSLAHIVADEAQDLSPMMLRALGRRSSTGSLTVLGDLAQATTPWATRTWAEALGHLGKPDAHVEELTRGFRVPGDVIEYAARLLPEIAPGLTPPTSVRRARGDLTTVAASGPLPDAVLAQVQAVVEREGSIGLIAPDALVPALGAALTSAGLGYALLGAPDREDEFEQHLDLVPATLAKGLEFDHVVLAEPSAVVAAEPDRVTGLRRLYVCLTRAVTSLVVVHREPLPVELAGRGGPPPSQPDGGHRSRA